jgi:hypothetical protein
MSRKGWLTVGLSLLLGTGLTSAPASALGHTIVTSHGARVEVARWGEADGEQGEVESPRSNHRGGEQTDAGSPRA